jgi:hypothetical protein
MFSRPENIAGLVWEEVAVKAIGKTVDGPRAPCPERWLAASSTTTEPSRTRSSPPATASSTPPTRETWRYSRSRSRSTLFPARPPPSSGSSRAAPTASFGSSGQAPPQGVVARSPACGRRGSSTAPKACRLGLPPRPVGRSASSRGPSGREIEEEAATRRSTSCRRCWTSSCAFDHRLRSIAPGPTSGRGGRTRRRRAHSDRHTPRGAADKRCRQGARGRHADRRGVAQGPEAGARDTTGERPHRPLSNAGSPSRLTAFSSLRRFS